MKFSSILVLFIVALAVCVPIDQAQAAGRTLARVDGEPITGDDLREVFATQHMGHTSFLAGRSEVEQALQKTIERTLLVHEAERMDLGSRTDIQEALDELAGRLAVTHLVNMEIKKAAQPTEEDIRAAYDTYTGHLLKVRQIVVPEEDEAREIAALLEGGEAFAALAKQRSQVQSSQAEGRLPPMGWGTMEEAWDEVAFRLEPGGISEPFPSGGAWEILLLEEKMQVEQPEYAAARSKLKGVLLRRGLDQKERTLSADLFEKYVVEVKLMPYERGIYDAALDKDPETVVAVWQDGDLRIRELAPRLNFDRLETLTPGQAAREIREAVRTSVTKPLLLLEARARKYEELEEIRSKVQAYRDKAILSVLHNEFILKDLVVTEEDVRHWYDSHTDEIHTSEKRFLSQIVVGTEEEAHNVQGRLSEGTPFADLAREISIDASSAPKGGAIGWVLEEENPPGFEEVFSLPQGEVSEPLKTEIGWHLIRILEIEPPRPLSYEEVHERIREHLVKEKREEQRKVWLAQLRDAAKIKIYEDAVSAFVEENAPASH